MRFARMISVVVSLSALISACGSEGSSPDPGPASSPPPFASDADFDPVNFSNPTEVTNPWFPLVPGTRFTWEGHATDDGERVSRAVVFTVTDLTKVVNGVRTIVAWDRDYNEGQLEEVELAFFAQDDDGNVWHFGQYPEEYDNGKFDKAPAWVAGFEGARPGITIKAEPHPGAPSYSQGFAPPPINWVDRARVYRTGQATCAPLGCYEDVLVTEEFERTKPGAFQLKYYAPGVGNVRVGWRGRNEKEQETLVIVDLIELDDEALAEIRAGVLELDENGYVRAEGSWGQTPPPEQLET